MITITKDGNIESTQEIVIEYSEQELNGETIRVVPFTNVEESSERGRLFAVFLVNNTPYIFLEAIREELNKSTE